MRMRVSTYLLAAVAAGVTLAIGSGVASASPGK
jgi:hypothetical protein